MHCHLKSETPSRWTLPKDAPFSFSIFIMTCSAISQQHQYYQAVLVLVVAEVYYYYYYYYYYYSSSISYCIQFPTVQFYCEALLNIEWNLRYTNSFFFFFFFFLLLLLLLLLIRELLRTGRIRFQLYLDRVAFNSMIPYLGKQFSVLLIGRLKTNPSIVINK